MIQNKYPDILSFWSELSSVQNASAVSSQSLREDIQHLKTGVKQVFEEIEIFNLNEADAKNPMNKQYIERLLAFSEQAKKKKLALIEEEMVRLNKESRVLASKFGEDPDNFKWEEFLQMLIQFGEAFEKTKIDIEKEKEEMKRMKRQKVKTAKKEGHVVMATPEKTEEVLSEGKVIERRKSIRRARSMRNSEKTEQKNLNSLLGMLDKMNKNTIIDPNNNNDQ